MARATRNLRSLPVWAISAIVFVTIAGALTFQDSPRAIGQEYATDATLSALTLSEVNFGAFASSAESYTASVVYSVYLTTVSPTVNHSGASYVIKLGGATDSDGAVSLSVGSNVITVEVTAEDGNTTKTYTVTVTRAANAYLALLSLSGIELEHDSVFYPPGFSALIYNYTVSVPYSLTETTVSATAHPPGASYVVKLNGATDSDGTISLAVGRNVITIEATSEDGGTKRTYTVTVNRAAPPSTDTTLSSLTLSGIDIGAFSSLKTSYSSANVYNSVSQTTVTPTLNQSSASYVVKLGGVTDADGAVSLAVGSNVITVEVTAEDGQTTRTYEATVNRASASAPTTGELSTDIPPVNFRNVRIDHESAVYSFGFPRNRGIYGWVIQRYERDGDSFVSSGPDMRSEHTGSTDLGGEGFKVGDSNVEPGVLYKWVLKLTSSGGSTVIETSLTVRAPPAPGLSLSSDATLSALTLSEVNFGAFASGTESYTAGVAYSVSQTTVTPTVNHSGASYVIKLDGVTDSDGTVSLAAGSNVITVDVTAEDGNTTKTYTVTVTRAAASSLAYLGLLNLSDIELEHDSVFHPPGFSSLIYSYTVDVPNSLTETTVSPTAHPSSASYVIKLNGATDSDGTVSLAVGRNVITIEVTAEDGVTKRTYTITVNRASPPSTDTTLSSLTLSGIDIGAFSSLKTSYSANVYNSVSQTTVAPTLNQSSASYVIKLGGVTDADGTVSLAVGSNVITIEVTAEDGQTTRTYKATVNRATASTPTTGELSTDIPPVNFRTVRITHDHAIYSFSFPRNRGIYGWVTQRYERDGSDFVSSGPDMRSEHTGTTDLGGGNFDLGDTNVEPDVLYKWTLELTNSQGSTVIETSLTVRAPAAPRLSLSSDATLSALTLNRIDFGTFASSTTTYSARVDNSVSTTTVTATPNHNAATYVVKLGGIADADGAVSLAVGSNVISVEVTAEDGSAARIYTVTVIRAEASASQDDSVVLFKAVVNDSRQKEALTDELSEVLADLLIEYLIAPETGETTDEVRTRLSEQDSYDLLLAALNDAVQKEALSDAVSAALADLFIEYLIAPVIGETTEEIKNRLSGDSGMS